MSISRGNWSTLSRLAQQWIEDDEEEQIRERRRRNRDVSSGRVVEVLPDTDNSQPVSSAAKCKDKQELLDQEKPKELQEHKEEKTETPKQHNENKLTPSKVEASKEVYQPKIITQEIEKATSKKEESPNHFNTSNNIPIQKENTSISQKKSILFENQQGSEPKGFKGALQNNQNVRRLNQKFSSWNEKDQSTKVQKAQIPETSSQNNKTLEEKKTEAQDNSAQKKNTSSTCSDPVSNTPSVPQNETNTSSSHGSQSRYKTQVFVSSVNIPRRSSSSCSIKSPPPVPEAIEEEPFPETKAGISEVVISTVPNSNLTRKQDVLPSSQQTSTSFVRLGPLSSSVRAKSQSEDEKDDGLTRRSSLRLSLRSRKIEDRMEKYTTALQRSASVRIPPSQSRGAIAATDGVATKRTIFEKDGENPAKSNIARKDLSLSGSVTSRINQWSNKAQESSSSVPNIKDFKTCDVATKRMLWQQKSQSSNDTKL
ncbi:ladinin-1 isoform X2 [Pyxicephalus adspersus]|uniref:ladinin-1 isoform X2 n=1 Tax=Pyxicephalus adspersus TaxID=30357 RepID=UPI003B59A336